MPHALVCPVLSHFGGCKCDADMESVLHMCLDVLALQHLEASSTGRCGMNFMNSTLSGACCSWSHGHMHSAEVINLQLELLCTRSLMQMSTRLWALQCKRTSVCSATQALTVTLFTSGEQLRAGRMGHEDFLLLQDHSADFSAQDRRDWLKALAFLEGALHKAAWPGACPKPQELLHIVGRIAANNFGWGTGPYPGRSCNPSFSSFSGVAVQCITIPCTLQRMD